MVLALATIGGELESSSVVASGAGNGATALIGGGKCMVILGADFFLCLIFNFLCKYFPGGWNTK